MIVNDLDKISQTGWTVWESAMQSNHCLNCGEEFLLKRNQEQRYCSEKACQRFRKNQWRRLKRAKDIDYRINQGKASQRWHQKDPTYWQHYRQDHPAYVEKNRVLQRLRDKNKMCKNKSSLLANSDAFSDKKPDISGTYELIPIKFPILAKSDAFIVKISVLSTR